MNEEQIDKIEQLVVDPDLTLSQISAVMGMSYHTFRVRLAESGYKIVRHLVSIERVRRTAPIDNSPKVAQ